MRSGRIPEFDPPDREPGEACEGHGSERRSIVGPDPIRESILSEQVPEDGPGACIRGARQSLAGEQIAAESVLDREGVTVDPIQSLELALEVGRPDCVGSIEGRGGPTGVRTPPAPWLLLHETLALEELVQDSGRGDGPIRVQHEEPRPDLIRAPAGASSAQREGRLEHLGVGDVGARMRTVGTVHEPVGPLHLVPHQPLVTGLPAHAVAPAQLGVGEEAALARSRVRSPTMASAPP